MIHVSCNICGFEKTFDDKFLNKKFICPSCKNQVKIEQKSFNINNQAPSVTTIQQPVNQFQTTQTINELKGHSIPTQFQLSSSTFGEWFSKNIKTVYIGAIIIIGLLILLVSIKYVKSLGSNKIINNVEKTQTTEPTYQESNAQNTQGTNLGNYQKASEKLLTSSDIVNLNKYELKIMRNEIYARYGYIFKTADMRTYFQSQSWYSPRYDDVTSFLTETEKRNIELIKRYE